MKLRITLLLILFAKCLPAQQYTTDARSLSVSNSFAASIQETGVPINIATILHQKNSFIEVTASNKYSLKELTTISASFVKKVNSNNSLLLSLSKTGTNVFSEQSVDAAISKRIATKFSTGVRLKYHLWTVNDSRYSKYQTLIPEISFLVNVLPNINLGVIVRNPVRSRIDAKEEKQLQAEIIAGASALISNKLIFSLASKSVSQSDNSFQAGIEYKYARQFILRTGFQSYPVSQSFGCELILSNYRLAIAIQTQSQLGMSSAISFTFNL